MISRITLVLLFMFGLCAVSATQTLVLDGGHVFDGSGAPPISNARIVVSGERIVCVGDAESCPVSAEAERVSLDAGTWVLPGLVDAHVHFGQTGWFDGRPSSVDLQDLYPYDETMARQKTDPGRYFRSYLCSGVTAVFDTGGYPWSLDLKSAAENDPFAPHIVAAGPRITHAPPAAMNLPSAEQYHYLADEETGRKAVRFLSAFGADAVKIWFLRVPAEQQASVDARVAAVANESAVRGLPLIVHATTLREAKVALRAGTHLLVHGVDDQPIDDEFVSLARKSRTLYTPTLLVNDGYRRMFEALTGTVQPELDDPNGCVDAETRRRILESPSLKDHPSVRALDLDLDAYANGIKRAFARKVENLLRAHRAGIPIVVGTDAGNPGSLHGPGIYAELEALQAAGIPPAELLVMATRNGARAMGRTDIGTLVAGNVSDLIVLSANPIEDVKNLRRITHVMRAGTLHHVDELSHR